MGYDACSRLQLLELQQQSFQKTWIKKHRNDICIANIGFKQILPLKACKLRHLFLLRQLAGGIDEWLGPAIEGAALAVGVSFVLVAIEDLHFVLAHEEDAAIAAALAIAFHLAWSGELDVQAAGAELLDASNFRIIYLN